ncbi:SAM-dependent methyltransferase [Amylibacter kogurei]|uniref:SAM-dependent methyltransferase n=1 Tax=Paramylibacter kogurei TaxID=1889778 RepID=A0A2G5KCG4_9RHOB|nr:methyltransferase domain-containing protein [Amylibacter kogurei]PIB26540.1 SAM-dependent methyltransferase [Amylibacter kogurei]
MQSPPKIFDTEALAMHRQRATCGDQGDWFLHDYAIDVVQERLQEVNRTFTDPTIIGWQGAQWNKKLGLSATVIPDTDTLDLMPNSCDLIIHALSLHWSNDPVGQLVQMNRALRPDGLMIAVMFGGQTLQELRIAFAQAESRVLGGISPHIAPMGEIRDLGGLLQRAGYALPVADAIDVNLSYQTPMHLMRELRGMGETNALMQRQKSPMRRDVLSAMIDEYQSTFATPDGRVNATMEFVFLTGWAPSDTQQKPLRPGSAQSRLAQALGVAERDLESE